MMASASCSAAMLSFTAALKPIILLLLSLTSRTHVDSSSNYKDYLITDTPKTTRMNKLHSIRVKAAANNGNTKPKSVVCADCDGNGAVLCSQCKGSGVNSVDFFGGQFKAGDSCWLCGGKKDMLCGNCNGAGFIGGFMSTKDE